MPVSGPVDRVADADGDLLGSVLAGCGLASYSRVLDLGSGRGTVLSRLAGTYGCAAIGLEPVPMLAAAARTRVAALAPTVRRRVRVTGTAHLAWRPGHPYDVVLAVESLAAVPDLAAVLSLAHDALRPGGRLCVSLVTAAGDRDPLSGPLRAAGFATVRHRDHSAQAAGASRDARTAARLDAIRAGTLRYRRWIADRAPIDTTTKGSCSCGCAENRWPSRRQSWPPSTSSRRSASSS